MKEEYTLLCERKAAFETNSSSSHSLVIDENSPLMSQEQIKNLVNMTDNKIHIYSDEYGWDIQTYTTTQSKLSYLYTYACGSESLTQELEEAIKEFTGYDVVFEQDSYSYIDHQSIKIPAEVFDKGKQAIIDFVFRSGSYFQTDNDNH